MVKTREHFNLIESKKKKKMATTDRCANESTNKCSSDKVQNDEINQNIVNKWDRFAEWIHAICVVTFDLELGQAMEVIIL